MLASNYGIPSGTHSHGSTPSGPAAPEQVRIALDQTRWDLRGERETGQRWTSVLRGRAAWVDYRHDEVANGVVATTFLNKAFEYRLEADHRPWERLTGTLGVHGVDRTFSAVGAEAFVPKSDIDALGIYAIERLDLKVVRFDAAYRSEQQRIRPGPQQTVFGSIRTFPETTYRPSTLSLGATVPLPRNSHVALTWSRPERAPDVQELYSLGPHLATRTFDLGQPNLRKESMTRWDLGFGADWQRVVVALNGFQYDAVDYIYARNTGLFYRTDIASIRPTCIRLEECLPVIQYDQQDATFRGYEAQATLRLTDIPKLPLDVTIFTDAVRGAFANGAGDVPRLPPRRTGMEFIAYPGDRSTVRLRWTRASAQDRPGVNETPTAGYDLVNLQFEYQFRAFGREESTFYVHLRNLLDQEIRNSTSFLRSFAPEPGRRLDVGVRFEF
jgi:iron complex outermembrane recepter protein